MTSKFTVIEIKANKEQHKVGLTVLVGLSSS